MKDGFVYIMASVTRTLYIGVTNSLERRVWQHQHWEMPGFTRRYDLTRLVYFEAYPDIRDAIAREKQLKSWRRSKKNALIENLNPKWEDLSVSLFEQQPRVIVDRPTPLSHSERSEAESKNRVLANSHSAGPHSRSLDKLGMTDYVSLSKE